MKAWHVSVVIDFLEICENKQTWFDSETYDLIVYGDKESAIKTAKITAVERFEEDFDKESVCAEEPEIEFIYDATDDNTRYDIYGGHYDD
jgi:hypothetical protein